MKVKIKKLLWEAGRPVVILNKKLAQKLNVNINERLSLKKNPNSINAVVDIFTGLTKDNEVGLSKETQKILNLGSTKEINISLSELNHSAEIIAKKIGGKELSKKEIETLVREITLNNLTEPEIAYFIAAEKMMGMTLDETRNLTLAMFETGNSLKINQKIVADKHCIGGIAGNRTTPIVVSICAAAGLTIPKNSSRAITSAAGTADVIETISKIEFNPKQLKSIVGRTNGCLVWGGALGLSPSDSKIIRVEKLLKLDVESQLLASILAKKLAAGSTHILIDIPFNGGKISKKSQAKELARKFRELGKQLGLKIKTVYTDGRQPIGRGVGPVLEMLDVISVLKNSPEAAEDLKEKSIYLAAELMGLCGVNFPKLKARRILESGKAYEKFKEIINTQNNANNFEVKCANLILAKYKKTVYAKQSGKITKLSNRGINSLCRILGTPETKSAGIYLHKKLGKIKKGEQILTFYTESKDKLRDAINFYKRTKPIILKH
jgi:putative thymidine phosphorylase